MNASPAEQSRDHRAHRRRARGSAPVARRYGVYGPVSRGPLPGDGVRRPAALPRALGVARDDRGILPGAPDRGSTLRVSPVRRGDPAGIFAASAVSRLQFLGARVAGVSIALFGGIATAVTMMAAASALWVMAQPAVVEDRAVLQALYWLVQAFGGAGFSVPFGLLVAGITIPAAFMRLVPKWIVVLGLAIALCGELSWLYFMIPDALPLVPLTRFPGFVWLIAIGLALPGSPVRPSP